MSRTIPIGDNWLPDKVTVPGSVTWRCQDRAKYQCYWNVPEPVPGVGASGRIVGEGLLGERGELARPMGRRGENP